MNVQIDFIQMVIYLILWFALGAAYDFIKDGLQRTKDVFSEVSTDLKERAERGKKAIVHRPRDIEMAVVNDFLESIRAALNLLQKNLRKLGKHFIMQVVAKEHISTEGQTTDSPLLEEPYAGQKIVGALVELAALMAFIWADAALAAQTYSILFSPDPHTPMRVPDLLNNTIVPLIVASAGSAFILGIFIGDALQLTHLGTWGDLSSRGRKIFLAVTLGNLIIVVALAAMVSLYRTELLEGQSEFIKMLASYAQSLVIVPMLITTTMLFRGLFGLYVILSLVVWLLSAPFILLEHFTDMLLKFVKLGVVSIDFLFEQIVWLVLLAFEIVIVLIKALLMVVFQSVIALLSILFYVPYLTVNGFTKKFAKGSIKHLFENMNQDVDDK